MKVLDPGHLYALSHLDGEGTTLLRFVKRIGDNFPGNEPPGYEGTTSQEAIRALLERQDYVSKQKFCAENVVVVQHLREALRQLEVRAARVRGDEEARRAIEAAEQPELLPTCPTCGHAHCKQERHT